MTGFIATKLGQVRPNSKYLLLALFKLFFHMKYLSVNSYEKNDPCGQDDKQSSQTKQFIKK
jgi:hypothetical protein